MEQLISHKVSSNFCQTTASVKVAKLQCVEGLKTRGHLHGKGTDTCLSSLSYERQQEYHLIALVQNCNDSAAAEHIMQSFTPLIKSVVHGLSGYAVEKEELLAEGRVALFKAIKDFDMLSGLAFATYAKIQLKWAMMHFVANNVRVMKFATTKARRKLFFKYRQLCLKHGASLVGKNKIAEELGVSLGDVEEMDLYSKSRDYSIQTPVSSGDDAMTFSDYLSDGSSVEDEYVKAREQDITANRLRELLGSLPERAREILYSRYYVTPKVSLAELGERFGISGARVEQLEKNALKLLRNGAMEVIGVDA